MFPFSKIWLAALMAVFWGASATMAGEYGPFNAKDFHERVTKLCASWPGNEKDLALLADEMVYRLGGSWHVWDKTVLEFVNRIVRMDLGDAEEAAKKAGKAGEKEMV